jgi:integrase
VADLAVSSPSTALARLAPAEQARVRALLDGAWARETRRAYGWGWRVFLAWCRATGRASLPAAPEEVALFVEAQLSGGRSAAAIRTMLAALRWIHEAAGWPSPTHDPAVRLAWKAASRALGLGAKRQKTPATMEVLARLVEQVDRMTLAGKRDAGVLLVGFHGAFRRSEIAAIRVEHVREVPGGIAVLIPKSKTDQSGEGETIGIAARGGALCAVQAVEEWRTASGVSTGRLFRAFALDGGLRETFGGAAVAGIVKCYATAAGLDATDFGGHSLRAGFVTEAYRRGASDAEIAGTTRHKSMTTLARYRRESDPVARGASRRMKK